MQRTTWRRALLLLTLLLASGGSFVTIRASLLQPRVALTATPLATCLSHSTDLIVTYPTPAPSDPTLLTLDLPGPILIEPTPCPAR